MAASLLMARQSEGLPRDVADFLSSMPAAYAQAFSLRDVEEHAGIVARRGALLAHAEAVRTSLGALLVCVVADDRPGLLSLVTDALLVHGFSVTSAQVYCRQTREEEWEAVDFFWLERAAAGRREDEIDASEVANLAQTLRDLITEEQGVSPSSSERDTVPVPMERPTRIYFDLDALRKNELVLVVEAPEFPGLLLAVSSALHGQALRILGSEIKTEHGIAKDRFSVESARGDVLGAERLYDVQQAVQTAIAAARSRG